MKVIKRNTPIKLNELFNFLDGTKTTDGCVGRVKKGEFAKNEIAGF